MLLSKNFKKTKLGWQEKSAILTIASWNINGLRSGQAELEDFLSAYQPDIVCLQETRLSFGEENHINFKGYFSYFYHANRAGYSGLAVFSKRKFSQVSKGIGVSEFDSEARVLIAKIDDLYIANLYFPHSRRDLTRLQFKMDFNYQIAGLLKSIPKNKLVICGDFNVAHQEIDIARPRDNRNNAGFTDIERFWMDEFLADGWIDVFRCLNPNEQKFTYWSNMYNAREKNIGWRIDYFIVSPKMFNRVESCSILTDVTGSDHCPIILKIK